MTAATMIRSSQDTEQKIIPPLDWNRALYKLQADGQVPARLQKHITKLVPALIVYANANGRNCHPGRDRLARELHMSERDLKATFDWLLGNGLLHLDKPAARRIGHAAVYSLTAMVPRQAEAEFMDTTSRFMDTTLDGIAPAFEAPASKGTTSAPARSRGLDAAIAIDDVPGPAFGGQASQVAICAYGSDIEASWHEHGLDEGLLASPDTDTTELLSAELGEDYETWREADVMQIVLGNLLGMDPDAINSDAARKALVQAMNTDCETHPALYGDGADHEDHRGADYGRSQCRCPLDGTSMWRALDTYWRKGPGRSQLDRGRVMNPAGLALSPAALASAVAYWRSGSGWREVRPRHRFHAGQFFRRADGFALKLLEQSGDGWRWEYIGNMTACKWEYGSVDLWETGRLREMFVADDSWRYR